MIITCPVGTLSDQKYKGMHVDYYDVEWYAVHKAIDRRATRDGTEVGVRMDHETKHRGWHQDDVVYADENKVIAVNILPCKCISVEVESYQQAVKLCYEIGNRHAPLFYGDNDKLFLTPFEAPMLVMIEKLGLNCITRENRLLPIRRISSAQGHGHVHTHEHIH